MAGNTRHYPMFDILTVVFQEELPILKVQAQSIDRYCSQAGIKNIFVIVNDASNVDTEIDPQWWGQFSDQVRIVNRSELGNVWSDNGWLSQQALKILGCRLSTNFGTAVLDAKTIFVQDLITHYNIISESGGLRTGQLVLPEVFKRSVEITNEVFGIQLESILGPGGVPFFFYNAEVREMIQFIEDKYNQPFAQWFQSQGMLTEFVLYSGFLVHKFGFLDWVADDRYHDVVNVCHSEVGRFDAKLAEMGGERVLTVSVHRHAWSQLSDQQRQAYYDFLSSRGLTVDLAAGVNASK